MEFQYEANRIFLSGDDGGLLAEVTFHTTGGIADIQHTFVDDSLRGQGIAARLMETLADELRTRGVQARPSCSYAAVWFSQHPEYADLL